MHHELIDNIILLVINLFLVRPVFSNLLCTNHYWAQKGISLKETTFKKMHFIIAGMIIWPKGEIPTRFWGGHGSIRECTRKKITIITKCTMWGQRYMGWWLFSQLNCLIFLSFLTEFKKIRTYPLQSSLANFVPLYKIILVDSLWHSAQKKPTMINDSI